MNRMTLLCLVVLLWIASVGEAAILWSTDSESQNIGGTNEWEAAWISGNASYAFVSSPAHGGTKALGLTITGADGDNPDGDPGVRMARRWTNVDSTNLPTTAYYSVWYYFPQVVTPVWNNIFQWKRVRADNSTSDPVFAVRSMVRSGNMYFDIYHAVGNDGQYNTVGVGVRASAPVGMDIPLNQWVHLECYYDWKTSATGQVTCWQNGVQLWDLQGYITEFNQGTPPFPRQWTVNNYAGETVPPTNTIYIDDAAISTHRISAGATPAAPTNLRVIYP